MIDYRIQNLKMEEWDRRRVEKLERLCSPQEIKHFVSFFHLLKVKMQWVDSVGCPTDWVHVITR